MSVCPSSLPLLLLFIVLCVEWSLAKDITIPIIRPASSLSASWKSSSKVTYHINQRLYPNNFFLHMHIPKTGGNTFKDLFIAEDNWAFNCGYTSVNDKRRFTIGDVIDRGQCSYFTYEMFDIESCAPNPKDNCCIGSLRTHFGCDHYCKVANMYDQYGAKNASGIKIHVMSLFRNPLQHALSAIAHTASRYKETQLKYCSSLREYLATDGKCYTYPIENFQTHVLTHPVNLDLAMKKLESLFFVGVTELYDASICVLGYQLGQFDVAKCNCSSTHGAVKAENTHSYSSILPSSMAYVGDITELMKKLDMDVVLYNRALEITIGRIEYVQRMTQTKLVCAAYESQHLKWARRALKVVPMYL